MKTLLSMNFVLFSFFTGLSVVAQTVAPTATTKTKVLKVQKFELAVVMNGTEDDLQRIQHSLNLKEGKIDLTLAAPDQIDSILEQNKTLTRDSKAIVFGVQYAVLFDGKALNDFSGTKWLITLKSGSITPKDIVDASNESSKQGTAWANQMGNAAVKKLSQTNVKKQEQAEQPVF